MEPGLVSNLMAALEAAYSKQTTDQTRQEANKFLEDFKRNNPPLVVLNSSMELLEKTTGTEVRYFALHAFEYVVLKNWNVVTLEDRALIKAKLLQLLTSPIADICTPMTKILAVKLGVVIKEVAIRDWPQLWPEMLPVLTSNATPSVGTPTDSAGLQPGSIILEGKKVNANAIHMALNVLADIYSAAFQHSPSIPMRRRKELQLGLQNAQEALVSFIASLLLTSCRFFGAAPQNAMSKTLLKASLNAFSALAERTNFEILQSSGLLGALRELLVMPESADEAHEILISLVCKKTTAWVNNPEEVLGLWEATLRFCVMVASPDVLRQIGFDRQTSYLLKSSRALKIFISTHSDTTLTNERLLTLSATPEKADPSIRDFASRYRQQTQHIIEGTIQALGALVSSQSLQVAMEGYTCWIDIFRVRSEIYLSDRTRHLGICVELFQHIMVHTKPRRWEDYQMEFSDNSQFQRAYGSLKVQALSTLQQISFIQPVELVRLIAERTMQCFTALSQIPLNDPNVFSRPSLGTSATSAASVHSSTACSGSAFKYDPAANEAMKPYVYGSSAVDSPAFDDVEACAMLIDHIMKTTEAFIVPIPGMHATNKPTVPVSSFAAVSLDENSKATMISTAENLMAQLSQFTHLELAFWTPKFRVFAACVPILTTSEHALGAFVSLALEQIQFNPNNCVFLAKDITSGTSTSTGGAQTPLVPHISDNDSKIFGKCPTVIEDLRRRGAYTLLTLGRRYPYVFQNRFGELKNSIHQLFQRGAVTMGEQIYLFEFLLSVSVVVSSLEEQQALAGELLSGSLAFISSGDLANALSSPLSYLGLAGCNAQEQAFMDHQLALLNQASATNSSLPVAVLSNTSKERTIRNDIYFTLNKISTVLRVFSQTGSSPQHPQNVLFKAISLPVSFKQQYLKGAASGDDTSRGTDDTMSMNGASSSNPFTAESPGGSVEPVHGVFSSLLPLVIPFIRIFIQRTNEATSEGNIASLPPRMHALGSPSYAHMLWTVKHDLGINNPSNVSTPESLTDSVPDRRRLLIRDVATWCEQSFEYACQVLQIATAGGHAFYEAVLREKDDWMNMFTSFRTAYSGRLRLFLVKFIQPFFLRCPVHLYNDIVLPFSLLTSSISIDLLGPSWNMWSKHHSLESSLYVNSYGSSLLRLRGRGRRIAPEVGLQFIEPSAALSLANTNFAKLRAMLVSSPDSGLGGPGAGAGAGAGVNTTIVGSISQHEQELEIMEDADVCTLTQSIAKLLYPLLEVTSHDQKLFERTLSSVVQANEPQVNANLANQANNFSSLSPIAQTCDGLGLTANGKAIKPSLGCEFIARTPSLRRCLFETTVCILCFGEPSSGKLAVKAIRRILPYLVELRDDSILAEIPDVLSIALRLMIKNSTNSSTSGNNGSASGDTSSSSSSSLDAIDDTLIDELSSLIRDAFVLLSPYSPIPQQILFQQCNITQEQFSSLMELFQSGEMVNRRGKVVFRSFLTEIIEANSVQTDQSAQGKRNDRQIVDLPPSISNRLESSKKKKQNDFSYASAMNLFI